MCAYAKFRKATRTSHTQVEGHKQYFNLCTVEPSSLTYVESQGKSNVINKFGFRHPLWSNGLCRGHIIQRLRVRILMSTFCRKMILWLCYIKHALYAYLMFGFCYRACLHQAETPLLAIFDHVLTIRLMHTKSLSGKFGSYYWRHKHSTVK